MLLPMVYSFLAAALFLVFISPFFLRSLRSTATRAGLSERQLYCVPHCYFLYDANA